MTGGKYFAEVFQKPRHRYIDQAALGDDKFERITAGLAMPHGRVDQPCPPELTTLVLARKLPRADVQLLAGCGHNLLCERPAAFL